MDAKKTVGFVDWSLLLLIGSALGLSKGIVNSGLADYVGTAIRDSGMSADASVFVLYLFTVVSHTKPFRASPACRRSFMVRNSRASRASSGPTCHPEGEALVVWDTTHMGLLPLLPVFWG